MTRRIRVTAGGMACHAPNRSVRGPCETTSDPFDCLDGSSNPAAAVKQVFEDSGITAFQGPTRKWTLEDYSSMLTRTILAEAHNTGAAMRYATNGVQFGQVIEHAEAIDATCKFMNGKAVNLADPRLLPPYHPNCMGGITPLMTPPEDPIMSPDDPRIPAEAQKMMLRK